MGQCKKVPCLMCGKMHAQQATAKLPGACMTQTRALLAEQKVHNSIYFNSFNFLGNGIKAYFFGNFHYMLDCLLASYPGNHFHGCVDCWAILTKSSYIERSHFKVKRCFQCHVQVVKLGLNCKWSSFCWLGVYYCRLTHQAVSTLHATCQLPHVW